MIFSLLFENPDQPEIILIKTLNNEKKIGKSND
jgi:hypothetical protein